MTIDEAIKHAEEVVEGQIKLCKRYDDASGYSRSHDETIRTVDAKKCAKCAEQHRQLVEWLKELKQLREQTRWIPVSERLPEDEELVLFSTKTDRVFEGRFFVDKTNLQWYAYRNKAFAYNNVVTAWLPLPKPYKAESEE